METIVVGSLQIPIPWLAFLSALFITEWLLKRRNGESLEPFIWTYLVIWKASYIVFYMPQFLEAPLSILYFDGGLNGHIAALVGVVIQLLVKHRQNINALWHSWLWFVVCYQVMAALLSQQWLLAIAGVVLVALLVKRLTVAVVIGLTLLIVYQYPLWHSWSIAWLTTLVLIAFEGRHTLPKSRFALALITALLSLMIIDEKDTLQATVTAQHEPIMLADSAQQQVTLSYEEHDVTILNFFATWCPPCKAEMPHLQRFASSMPDNVQLIGINLTARDHGTQALSQFIEQYEVSYPILLDVDDTYGKQFGVLSIPTTVVLNKKGQEVGRVVGAVSDAKLQQLIREAQ